MSGPQDIRRAAALLRAGELVAFPTETVYGLGANALDAQAVARIYQAKGRPSTSPLIVHVDSPERARELVLEWPEAAARLAARWWPGPLTIVLPKSPSIPDIVTAGLPTVGLRVPAHPLALELLRAAEIPVAAPSANRFTRLSPTRAEHVRAGLGDAVAMILDGGPCTVGIESTVVSLAGERPVLLRPGGVSQAEIEAITGPLAAFEKSSGADPSPGLHHRHYSPRTPLVLDVPAQGRGVYLYRTEPLPGIPALRLPAEPEAFAATLYETLHRLDEQGLDWIALEPLPQTAAWAAVADRVTRAMAL